MVKPRMDVKLSLYTSNYGIYSLSKHLVYEPSLFRQHICIAHLVVDVRTVTIDSECQEFHKYTDMSSVSTERKSVSPRI